MDAIGFVMDHLGHFAPLDIVNLLFAVLVATLLGYLLARLGGRRSPAQAKELALWAAISALGTGLVRAQLPLAVALLALVLLAKGREGGRAGQVLLFGALVIGLGCGSGASLVMLVVALPFILVIRWAFGAEQA